MVDFDNGEGEVSTSPSGKKVAEQITTVRQRGMLNAGLDILASNYLKDNPGQAVRWEFYNPKLDNGDQSLTMREAMGWKVVSYADLLGKTESTPRDGPVRRGDLIMMTAPKAIEEAERRQDEEAARADVKAPERAFKDAVESKKVTLSGGETDQAKGFGQIKMREEMVRPLPETESNGGS